MSTCDDFHPCHRVSKGLLLHSTAAPRALLRHLLTLGTVKDLLLLVKEMVALIRFVSFAWLT